MKIVLMGIVPMGIVGISFFPSWLVFVVVVFHQHILKQLR
jgi:hypothetical protein